MAVTRRRSISFLAREHHLLVVWSTQCRLVWPFFTSRRFSRCWRPWRADCIVQSCSFFLVLLGTVFSTPTSIPHSIGWIGGNDGGGKLHRYNIMRMANSTHFWKEVSCVLLLLRTTLLETFSFFDCASLYSLNDFGHCCLPPSCYMLRLVETR